MSSSTLTLFDTSPGQQSTIDLTQIVSDKELLINGTKGLLYADTVTNKLCELDYTGESSSTVPIDDLPPNCCNIRSSNGLILLVTSKGELFIKEEDCAFALVSLVPPSSFCPHGIASTEKSTLHVVEAIASEKAVVVTDENGCLWTFKRNTVVRDSRGRTQTKALPLMGGMRKCTQIAAGRSHFVALVVSANNYSSNEIDDSISTRSLVIEENASMFSECSECQEESNFRLSTLMKDADKNASTNEQMDLMRLLENEEDQLNRSMRNTQDLRLRIDSNESSPIHTSTPKSSKVKMRNLHKSSQTQKNPVDGNEGVSNISFLSLDKLPLQTEEESAQSSPTLSTRKTTVQDDHPLSDQFIEVWSWGDNTVGQLGHGDNVNRTDPFPISFLSEHHVVKIAAGDLFSIVLTANGEIFTWGESLQQSACSTVNTTPILLKMGYDQYAIDMSVYGSSASILVFSSSNDAMICLCCREGTGRVMKKLPPANKSFHPLSLSVFSHNLVIRSIERNDSIGDTVSLWIELVRMGRLLSTLAKLTQQMHEYSRVSCAEDLEATVADLFHRLHLETVAAATTIASTSRSLGFDFTTKGIVDPIEHIFNLHSSTFLISQKNYFTVLSEAIAFGCFHVADISEQSDSLISRLCLEYGTESASLHSRLLKLFSRPIEFWSTLKCNASELMQVEPKIPTHPNRLRFPVLFLDKRTRTLVKVNIDRCSRLRESIRPIQSIINYANLSIGNARRTANYWKKPLDDVTCSLLHSIGRFLLAVYPISTDLDVLRVNTVTPKTFVSSPKYHTVLLFNDVIVLLEKKDYRILPLKLAWLKSISEDGKSILQVNAPEVELLIEMKNDEIKNKFCLCCEQWSSKHPAPHRRFGKHKYTQSTSTELIGATYEGMWMDGKPHGKGQLRMEDGTEYNGNFVDGEYNGFGVLSVPVYSAPKEETPFSSFFYNSPLTKSGKCTVYKGVFQKGGLQGLAHIKYSNGDVYEGYCNNGEAHGFGFFHWERGCYLGGFRDGRMHGYGVRNTRRVRYLGEWANDKMNGHGAMVTIDGSYHEGIWKDDVITNGRIVCPPSSNTLFCMEYTGDFEDYGKLSGKGTALVSPSIQIVGHLSGDILRGEVKIVEGIMSVDHESPSLLHQFLHDSGAQYSELMVPTVIKWREMFDVYMQEELGGSEPSPSSAWNRIVSGMRRGKHLLEGDEGSQFPSELERIPEFDSSLSIGYYIMVEEYVNKSVVCRAHPLYRLFHGVSEVFIASYKDVGIHHSLYHHAVLELKSLIHRIYNVMRTLFPSLPEDLYDTVPDTVSLIEYTKEEYADSSTEGEITPDDSPKRQPDSSPSVEVPRPCADFIYSFIFPKVFPILNSIYSLVTQELDSIYWNRAVYLNAHTDIKLLTYLEVPRPLWPIDSGNIGDLEKPLFRATARKKFYETAIDTLQQLSTVANPTVKLVILADTFDEITKCVSRFAEAGSSHLWGSDDLLPAFMYVVVRSQIQHLGCEIKLLDDFTKDYRGHGQIDLMFTMLKSSYVQIVNEKGLA